MAELSVNPEAVHRSGISLHSVAHSLHSEMSATDEQIAASHSGWVGKSAEALAAVATEWQQATRDHHGAIANHGEKFVRAATMYRGVDADSADRVRSAGRPADSVTCLARWGPLSDVC